MITLITAIIGMLAAVISTLIAFKVYKTIQTQDFYIAIVATLVNYIMQNEQIQSDLKLVARKIGQGLREGATPQGHGGIEQAIASWIMGGIKKKTEQAAKQGARETFGEI